MATEDLTTYTEVDPDGDLSATSSTLTVSTNNNRIATTYFYKDAGASHFTDFDIDFEFNVTVSQDVAFGTLCSVANTLGDTKAVDTASTGIYIATEEAGATNDVFLVDSLGDFVFSTGISISRSTTYYVTFTRVGTTATLNIFTDSGRSSHVSGSPVTLTVATTALRYVYLYSSYDDDAGGSDDFSCTIANLDLNEVAAGATWPGYISATGWR